MEEIVKEATRDKKKDYTTYTKYKTKVLDISKNYSEYEQNVKLLATILEV